MVNEDEEDTTWRPDEDTSRPLSTFDHPQYVKKPVPLKITVPARDVLSPGTKLPYFPEKAPAKGKVRCPHVLDAGCCAAAAGSTEVAVSGNTATLNTINAIMSFRSMDLPPYACSTSGRLIAAYHCVFDLKLALLSHLLFAPRRSYFHVGFVFRLRSSHLPSTSCRYHKPNQEVDACRIASQHLIRRE